MSCALIEQGKTIFFDSRQKGCRRSPGNIVLTGGNVPIHQSSIQFIHIEQQSFTLRRDNNIQVEIHEAGYTTLVKFVRMTDIDIPLYNLTTCVKRSSQAIKSSIGEVL